MLLSMRADTITPTWRADVSKIDGVARCWDLCLSGLSLGGCGKRRKGLFSNFKGPGIYPVFYLKHGSLALRGEKVTC